MKDEVTYGFLVAFNTWPEDGAALAGQIAAVIAAGVPCNEVDVTFMGELEGDEE